MGMFLKAGLIKSSVPTNAGTLIIIVKNKDVNNFVRNINNILRKNRRVLEELNPNGKAKAHKTQMIDKGFNFNYHTKHLCYQIRQRIYFLL